MDVGAPRGKRMMLEEVVVQKWKKGQIIHERFYNNMPGEIVSVHRISFYVKSFKNQKQISNKAQKSI